VTNLQKLADSGVLSDNDLLDSAEFDNSGVQDPYNQEFEDTVVKKQNSPLIKKDLTEEKKKAISSYKEKKREFSKSKV
jgi:hypothetical protein